MAFGTVASVITQARVLLQDKAADRYPDADLIAALNEGLLESRRLRPDMFRDTLTAVPQYEVAAIIAGTPLAYEQSYIPALVNWIAGRIQLQDDEATNDARATVFLNTFVAKLTTGQA